MLGLTGELALVVPLPYITGYMYMSGFTGKLALVLPLPCKTVYTCQALQVNLHWLYHFPT